MADETTAAEEAPVTFHVKSSGNAKYTLTLPLSTTTLELKNKLATAEFADIPPESQRLIYSGRVLKDNDTLATHKVKEGNTMHLVKSAPSNQRQNPANSGTSTGAQATNPASSPASSAVPTNLATGPGNNPLAGLTGARYAGFAQLPGAGMFGPDGGMGPPPGPDQMIDMLSNPQFAQMMNEALQNPQMIDMMIQQNPQLRAMGPQARQMLQSEHFRRMITDPQALRSMAQLHRSLGVGGFGGAGGQQGFPAPGVTSTTESQESSNQSTQNQSPDPNSGNQQNPFASLFGNLQGAPGSNPFALFSPPLNPQSQPNAESRNNTSSPTGNAPNTNQAPQNPLASLLNPALFGQQPQQSQTSGTGTAPSQQFNPFASLINDPAMYQNFMQSMSRSAGGAGGVGAAGGDNPWQNLFGGLGGMGSPPAPPDNRPPEERYAEQLRQLNDMGFYDFDRNVQALSRSGGSVQGAIEHLLGNP
ncbi:putative ubiquitin-like protein [Phaeomoniella chlamydospora]|uniref:Putative ubiquitin-like protein n=1 Tax=Phaeomoniella chlamydospora TaxID=158046 RepID=A0A0G2DYG9_PHACM|nr:putative ubiquitin-like protein [Phaeomoniella chlamydospora]